MRKSFLVNPVFICGLFLALSVTLPAATAQAAWPFFKTDEESKKSEEVISSQATAMVAGREEPSKIDTILTTLNQSLEENKKLRAEAESTQEQIGKTSIENNVLKSQLRSLQAQADTYKSELDEKEKKAQENMVGLMQQIEKLQEEQKKSEEFRSLAKESIVSTESENIKLKRLLEKAILQSERDEYVRLISESEAKAQSAARQMMTVKRQGERMKSELAGAYYNLGNMLSEAGNHRGAITQYKKALKLNPNDAWCHYNLAVIYDYYLNNRAKSLAHYKRYLNLEPAKAELDKVRERVLEIELLDSVTPKAPLRADFEDYTKDLNKPYTVTTKA